MQVLFQKRSVWVLSIAYILLNPVFLLYRGYFNNVDGAPYARKWFWIESVVPKLALLALQLLVAWKHRFLRRRAIPAKDSSLVSSAFGSTATRGSLRRDPWHMLRRIDSHVPGKRFEFDIMSQPDEAVVEFAEYCRRFSTTGNREPSELPEERDLSLFPETVLETASMLTSLSTEEAIARHWADLTDGLGRDKTMSNDLLHKGQPSVWNEVAPWPVFATLTQTLIDIAPIFWHLIVLLTEGWTVSVRNGARSSASL